MENQKDTYFGSYKMENMTQLTDYMNELAKCVYLHKEDGHPIFDGGCELNFEEHLNTCNLNEHSMSADETFKYLSSYFKNVPDWNNPGTMVNVIPSVNLVSLAVGNMTNLHNPNFAQDTYSGNLIISELEVVKYMSELIGWNWKNSWGIFTFGGTGTNLYGLKLSILNADPSTRFSGVKSDDYFVLTSKNGHPCHFELCDWVGLGRNSAIEIGCLVDGRIDTDELKRVIYCKIREGKKFLGVNLTGGSTNELAVDSIKEVSDIIDQLMYDFELDYRPMIHVDSVLGWVYLFYKGYDFEENKLSIPKFAISKIKKMYERVEQLKYADSIGIDFHKTGFTPYISSVFIIKDREKYFELNPEKNIAIKDLFYGNYNPFYSSLEYSRSGFGSMAALASLKSLGMDGYRSRIAYMWAGTEMFREKLSCNNKVLVTNLDTEGFCTLFILKPPGKESFSLNDFLELNQEQKDAVRQFNVDFGKHVMSECIAKKTSFFFTSSRSYVIPGTNVKLGMLKAYPMSAFFNVDEADRIVNEINESIERFYGIKNSGVSKGREVFIDMTNAVTKN